MSRILISVLVATVTTFGCHAWQECQRRAKGISTARVWRHWIVQALCLLAPMTLIVWIGFLEPVRSLDTYPFYRLGVSFLLGGGFVIFLTILFIALRALEAGEDVPKRQVWWRHVNPTVFQIAFLLCIGLIFQHSRWGGPP